MIDVQHRRWVGNIEWAHYSATGETAIRLRDKVTQEPLVTATVCPHPPTPPADANHVWLKTWSDCEGLPAALVEAGVVELTDTYARAGHALMQLARLTDVAKAERALAYAANPVMAANRDAVLARQAKKESV